MKILKIMCLAGLILSLSCVLFAEEAKRVATVKEISGAVELKTPTGNWIPAKLGMKLNEGDFIRTKANSIAMLNLNGAGETATLELKENSQMKLEELLIDAKKGTQKTLLDLALGEVLIRAQKIHSEKSKFEIKTPTSIVGVRGTTFSVSVEAVE